MVEAATAVMAAEAVVAAVAVESLSQKCAHSGSGKTPRVACEYLVQEGLGYCQLHVVEHQERRMVGLALNAEVDRHGCN
jgi:hypothetical protein